MRPVRVAGIAILMTALAAPAPAPPAETVARSQIESAVTFEKAGRYGEAIAALSSALASKALSDADTARALFDRGLAYDGLGNMRATLADYSAALQRDPSLTAALSNRADTYRRAGHIDEAKRDYWAALKAPAGAREYPYLGLGQIALQEGDTAAARRYFQQALAANPNFAPAAKSLAAVLAMKTESGLRPSQEEDVTTAAPVAVAAPALTPAQGGVHALVQLGAFQSEAIAQGAWVAIAAASGEVLHGLTPLVTPVDAQGKRLWRLRTAVADKAQAAALCAALTQRQLACVTVRR